MGDGPPRSACRSWPQTTVSGVDFLTRLRTSADTLDIQERQRIARLVIKDILVGDETIVIRHSIPLSSVTPSGDGGVQSKSAVPPGVGDRSYLLRSGSHDAALWNALLARSRQHNLQKMHDFRVINPLRHLRQQPV